MAVVKAPKLVKKKLNIINLSGDTHSVFKLTAGFTIPSIEGIEAYELDYSGLKKRKIIVKQRPWVFSNPLVEGEEYWLCTDYAESKNEIRINFNINKLRKDLRKLLAKRKAWERKLPKRGKKCPYTGG